MSVVDEVMVLVRQVAQLRMGTVSPRATSTEVDALGTRIGLPIPSEPRDWLVRHNGALIGPSGLPLLGIRAGDDFNGIEAYYRLFPYWREKGWIPVAGDGCGDYYVLDTMKTTRTGHPILFLDHEESVQEVCDAATYVVASGLWLFLRYALLCELHAAHNLFDKHEALREDLGLADDVGVPRSWEE